MENRVTKVEEMIKKFERKQKRIDKKYDKKEIMEELKEVERTLKRKNLHIERLEDELEKVNPSERDLIEEYYKAIQREYDGFVDEKTGEKSEGTKYYLERQSELKAKLLVNEAEKEKKHNREIRNSEDELRKSLTQEAIQIDKDINKLELNVKLALADMRDFQYEYEEYEYEDENGKKVIGKKILNGDKYREINEKYEDLNKELINLHDAKKLCESKLKEFKDKDNQEASRIAQIWNETKKVENQPIEEPIEEESLDEEAVEEDSPVEEPIEEESLDEETVEEDSPVEEPIEEESLDEEAVEEDSPVEESQLYNNLRTPRFNYVQADKESLDEEPIEEDSPVEKPQLYNLQTPRPDYVRVEEVNLNLPEDIKIVIGRKGKIVIGDKEYKISSKKIKEGVTLTNDEKLNIILDHTKCIDFLEGKTEEEINNYMQNLDGAVINAIYFAEGRAYSLRDGNSDALENLMYQYLSGIEKAKNNEENSFFIKYDLNDLSRANVLNRILKKEVTEKEKFSMMNYAKKYERYGLARQKGKYKTDFVSRLFARINKREPLKLTTREDEEVVARIYDELRDKNQTQKLNENKFLQSLKVPRIVKGRDGKRHMTERIENKRQMRELKELHKSQEQQESEEYFDDNDER